MNRLNIELLEAIDSIDENIVESDFNVCIELLNNYAKTRMIAEHVETESIDQFEIIQEFTFFQEGAIGDFFASIGRAIKRFFKHIAIKLGISFGGIFMGHKVNKVRRKFLKANRNAKKQLKRMGRDITDIDGDITGVEAIVKGYTDFAVDSIGSFTGLFGLLSANKEEGKIKELDDLVTKIKNSDASAFHNASDLIKGLVSMVPNLRKNITNKELIEMTQKFGEALAESLDKLAAAKFEDASTDEEYVNNINNALDHLKLANELMEKLTPLIPDEGSEQPISPEILNQKYAELAATNVKGYKPFVNTNGDKVTFEISPLFNIVTVVSTLDLSKATSIKEGVDIINHNINILNANSKGMSFNKKHAVGQNGNQYDIKHLVELGEQNIEKFTKDSQDFINKYINAEHDESDKKEFDNAAGRLSTALSSEMSKAVAIVLGIQKTKQFFESFEEEEMTDQTTA